MKNSAKFQGKQNWESPLPKKTLSLIFFLGMLWNIWVNACEYNVSSVILLKSEAVTESVGGKMHEKGKEVVEVSGSFPKFTGHVLNAFCA